MQDCPLRDIAINGTIPLPEGCTLQSRPKGLLFEKGSYKRWIKLHGNPWHDHKSRDVWLSVQSYTDNGQHIRSIPIQSMHNLQTACEVLVRGFIVDSAESEDSSMKPVDCMIEDALLD